MAEPFATSEPEEAAADATASRERFEHASPVAVPEAEAASAETAPAAAEEPAPAAVEPEASLPERVDDVEPESDSPAQITFHAAAHAPIHALTDAAAAVVPAPEWPVAWLRLVEPEPQAPEDDVVAAVLAAEAADADGVAHAFGQVMAAALDPEGQAEPAGEPAAANDLAPIEPVRLRTARPRRVVVEDAPAAMDETLPPPEAPVDVKPFNPRSYAPRQPVDHDLQEARSGEGGLAMMVYLLYLAGFLCAPAVAGVIIALNARRDAPEWLESHYVFQIRTFWIGLVGVAIAAVLLLSGALTLVGLMLGLFLIVWLLGRSALGFINVVKLRPYPHPRAWLL